MFLLLPEFGKTEEGKRRLFFFFLQKQILKPKYRHANEINTVYNRKSKSISTQNPS